MSLVNGAWSQCRRSTWLLAATFLSVAATYPVGPSQHARSIHAEEQREVHWLALAGFLSGHPLLQKPSMQGSRDQLPRQQIEPVALIAFS